MSNVFYALVSKDGEIRPETIEYHEGNARRRAVFEMMKLYPDLVKEGYSVKQIKCSIYQEPAMKIIVPYPPSVNRFWMNVYQPKLKRVITFPTTEAKEYMKRVREIFLESNLPKVGGDIALTMTFYRPQRSGDLDNFFKAPIDALKNFAYFDDKHIVEIIAHRKDDPRNPRVEIEITPVGKFAEQL